MPILRPDILLLWLVWCVSVSKAKMIRLKLNAKHNNIRYFCLFYRWHECEKITESLRIFERWASSGYYSLNCFSSIATSSTTATTFAHKIFIVSDQKKQIGYALQIIRFEFSFEECFDWFGSLSSKSLGSGLLAIWPN